MIIGTPGSFVVQVTATPTVPGNFANARGGGACAADPDGWIAESNKQNNNCSDAVNVIAADLRLTEVGGVSGGFANAGSNVSYLITVTNNGPSSASNVVVTDSVSANITFVSCTPSVGTCSGGASVTANLGSLANGAQSTVTIVARVECNIVNGTGISKTASVTSSTFDSNPANNNNNGSPATFTASNPVPVVSASVALSSLAQNNHELVNVGLVAMASDGACPAPTTLSVQVFGDEDDQTPTDQMKSTRRTRKTSASGPCGCERSVSAAATGEYTSSSSKPLTPQVAPDSLPLRWSCRRAPAPLTSLRRITRRQRRRRLRMPTMATRPLVIS